MSLARVFATAIAAVQLACSDVALTLDGGPVFVLQVSGEQFRVRVATDAQAAILRQHMSTGRVGVIAGRLVAGSGVVNAPWSWHLDAATVEAPDVAIELCDGRPSMVEGNLAYWLGSVKQYCPWGARVVAEE